MKTFIWRILLVLLSFLAFVACEKEEWVVKPEIPVPEDQVPLDLRQVPWDIELPTQEAVDQFDLKNSPYYDPATHTLRASIAIGDPSYYGTLTDITDLSKFRKVKRVIGNLSIRWTRLDDLQAFVKLRSVEVDPDRPYISTGQLTIEYNPLLTRLGLHQLTRVHTLRLSMNAALQDLKGLHKLDWVEDQLVINRLHRLTSLKGLQKLRYVGFLQIGANDGLASLKGLKSLRGVHELIINNNDRLVDLRGLEQLRSSTGFIELAFLSSLQSLRGLDQLASVNYLMIDNCPALQSLEGLEHLETANRLNVFECDQLPNLVGLDRLRSFSRLTVGQCDAFESLVGMPQLERADRVVLRENPIFSDCPSVYRLEDLGILVVMENNGVDCIGPATP